MCMRTCCIHMSHVHMYMHLCPCGCACACTCNNTQHVTRLGPFPVRREKIKMRPASLAVIKMVALALTQWTLIPLYYCTLSYK